MEIGIAVCFYGSRPQYPSERHSRVPTTHQSSTCSRISAGLVRDVLKHWQIAVAKPANVISYRLLWFMFSDRDVQEPVWLVVTREGAPVPD
jgi:hypothetical protein